MWSSSEVRWRSSFWEIDKTGSRKGRGSLQRSTFNNINHHKQDYQRFSEDMVISAILTLQELPSFSWVFCQVRCILSPDRYINLQQIRTCPGREHLVAGWWVCGIRHSMIFSSRDSRAERQIWPSGMIWCDGELRRVQSLKRCYRVGVSAPSVMLRQS